MEEKDKERTAAVGDRWQSEEGGNERFVSRIVCQHPVHSSRAEAKAHEFFYSSPTPGELAWWGT